jgi:1,2-phenylacetyl-CoA epoxidase catalytic subunit
MSDDNDILGYLARGGRIASPQNAPPRYRAELLRIMASFVDSELAGAAGFAERINDAPGVKAKMAAARITLEKIDHAERVLKLMADFGADVERYQRLHPWADRLPRNAALGPVRQAGDMRLNVFRYPLCDWTDAVVMNVLMGEASVIQVEDLSHSSYQPFGEVLRAVLPREKRHAELGREGLELIAARGAAGREAISASVDYWWPRVAETFGDRQSKRSEQLKAFGLRRRSNEDLIEDWRARMSTALSASSFGWRN